MILKRFIERLTPSSHHSSHHQPYLPLNTDSSSPNIISDESVSTENTIRNCRLIRRVSETAESFDDHPHHHTTSNDNHNCGSSCTSFENFVKIDHDHDDLHLHHDHNTQFLHNNSNHPESIMKKLNEMRKNNLMCDITLVCDGIEINCHKSILATNSSYFMAMFSSGLIESNSKKVEIKEIDTESLKLTIDYMYTGEILITENNVQALLTTTNLLNLCDLKQSCGQFIQSQLDVTNCLGIREFADRLSCQVLLKFTDAFIEQYFCEIVQKDEFLDLDEQELKSLISKDTLAVNSEKIVYDSVFRWINHDYENRIKYLGNLMKNVRFGLLKHEELVQISENPLIKANLLCMELIVEAFQYKMVKSNGDELSKFQADFDKTRIKPRVALGLPKLMYIFGGQAPKAIAKIDIYDFRSQEWIKCNDMPTKRCRSGVAYFDQKIFIVGGFNGQTRVRTVDIYNPRLKEWSQGPEMTCRRGTLGVGILNGKIYAVGGFDGVSGLNSVECWNMKNNDNWYMVASMSTRRSSVGIAVLNNYLYAIGGYCGLSRECLDSVEKYDPLTDKWFAVPSMSTRRSGACANVYDGKIYVIGGHDGPHVLTCVEVYDPITNHWRNIASLNVARRNAGFVIHNGLFYVIGGDDGHKNLESVEIYNPQRNVWSLLSSFLNEARSYSSCVVIENFN
ncbi:unnamed protein product [Brachionus calyciflorus]|uniref:BTB domain-containing protein n=1 Tax=Brachionus calyciflorus TaxID=104777 RepID=A0A813M7D6_9BILA|nr:unnamed protein product [Brachionus calyciflorus]